MTPVEKMARAAWEAENGDGDWDLISALRFQGYMRAALCALAECELSKDASKIGRETLLAYGNSMDDAFRAICLALADEILCQADASASGDSSSAQAPLHSDSEIIKKCIAIVEREAQFFTKTGRDGADRIVRKLSDFLRSKAFPLHSNEERGTRDDEAQSDKNSPDTNTFKEKPND